MNNLKTIGILGGMSWESTVLYYQWINRFVRDAVVADGGDSLTSAPMLIDSVDFSSVAQWQRDNDWALAARYFINRAQKLEQAGADCIGIATNTMHLIYDDIAAAVRIPVLHIGTVVCDALKKSDISRVVFLGTYFTMTGEFMRQKYAQQQVEWVLPTIDEINAIHHIIYHELCQGIIRTESKAVYLRIIERLIREESAQAVVLGCTEITLLIGSNDVSVPIFDSTKLHSKALADFSRKETQ